ncbi:MAG: hypothetical protein AABW49_00940 [Nanoarchaeota archaeon]
MGAIRSIIYHALSAAVIGSVAYCTVNTITSPTYGAVNQKLPEEYTIQQISKRLVDAFGMPANTPTDDPNDLSNIVIHGYESIDNALEKVIEMNKKELDL